MWQLSLVCLSPTVRAVLCVACCASAVCCVAVFGTSAHGGTGELAHASAEFAVAPFAVGFDHMAGIWPFLDLIQTEFHLAALQLTQRRYVYTSRSVAANSSFSYFYGRISKEEAEALVRRRGGSYLLRWSASMAGVYFVVASSKDGTGVRHIQIEKASDRQGRSVTVKMPVIDESGKKGYEIKLFDHLFVALEALLEPYHLKHPLTGSPYYTPAP